MTIALDGRRRHLALIEISSPSHLASPSPFLPKATIGNSMTTRFFLDTAALSSGRLNSPFRWCLEALARR